MIITKNIFEKNIFEKNIFEKNIFEKNVNGTRDPPTQLDGKFHRKNPYFFNPSPSENLYHWGSIISLINESQLLLDIPRIFQKYHSV